VALNDAGRLSFRHLRHHALLPETLLGGKWFTALAAMAMPRPGYCVPYGVFATRRTADMEESMAINHIR
jgi:hypothetical protein